MLSDLCYIYPHWRATRGVGVGDEGLLEVRRVVRGERDEVRVDVAFGADVVVQTD